METGTMGYKQHIFLYSIVAPFGGSYTPIIKIRVPTPSQSPNNYSMNIKWREQDLTRLGNLPMFLK